MDKVAGLVIAVAVIACMMLANAGTLYVAYNWVVAPSFAFPNISFAQAFAAWFFIGAVIRSGGNTDKPDISKPFARFLIVLIVSWLISFFI